MSFRDVFDLEIAVDAANRDGAVEAIEAAATRRGREAVAWDRQAIESVSTLSLARLLWVDDHADHNCYGTVALERIGILVTVATSTEAARFYLQQMPFDLLITDLGRDAEPEAGRDLLRMVRTTRPELPVIVYTRKAEPVRAGLLAEGAAAVVDLPGDLIVAVQDHRPRGPRRSSTPSGRRPRTLGGLVPARRSRDWSRPGDGDRPTATPGAGGRPR